MTTPQQQKTRIAGPVVLTANRLGDGKPVWRTFDGSWTTELAVAAVITSAEDAWAMRAVACCESLRVVDPYIAPAETDATGRVAPANLRETIRRDGPTVSLPERD